MQTEMTRMFKYGLLETSWGACWMRLSQIRLTSFSGSICNRLSCGLFPPTETVGIQQFGTTVQEDYRVTKKKCKQCGQEYICASGFFIEGSCLKYYSVASDYCSKDCESCGRDEDGSGKTWGGWIGWRVRGLRGNRGVLVLFQSNSTNTNIFLNLNLQAKESIS